MKTLWCPGIRSISGKGKGADNSACWICPDWGLFAGGMKGVEQEKQDKEKLYCMYKACDEWGERGG